MEDITKFYQNISNFKRVFIQFPDGFKSKALELANFLESKGIEVVLCLENTYGACDVREYEAKLLKCNAILHIGHTNFGVKTKIPVFYYSYILDFNEKELEDILVKNLKLLNDFEKIGLVSSVNYYKALLIVKNFLEKNNKKVFTDKVLEYPGQIIGCNVSAAIKIERKVDCFLTITTGKFYVLGLLLRTKKPVFVFDLDKKIIYDAENVRKKYLKIIVWNKSLFKDAKNVGILVSWKRGQMFVDPFYVKRKIEKMGKKCYILAFDEITKEKLEGLKLDFLINCACPRIFPDDYERFNLPILNYFDVI